MKAFLYPYDLASQGSTSLAQAIGIKRVSHNNSKLKGSKDTTIINWGASSIPNPEVHKCNLLNAPDLTAPITNKLSFFRLMEGEGGPRIPPFTDNLEVAVSWLAERHHVCIRSILNGSAARGLSIVGPHAIDQMKKAPLYTRYIPKRDEYRLHFAFGKLIDFQRKALRKTDDNGDPIDTSGANFRIRNLENGFVFVRENVTLPADVTQQASLCFEKSKLHFGAVDVVYSEKHDRAYVLEINTAPGLCNTTLASYANAFREALNG
jgi:hypothetical protein